MVYELFYHPGFTGRLEPVLTLLADAGVDYELSREPPSQPQEKSRSTALCEPTLIALNMSDDGQLPGAGDVASAVEDGVGVPPFFCPILRDGEFTLAQTPAIMEFLGRKHGCASIAYHLLVPLSVLMCIRADVPVLIGHTDIPEGAEEQANCLQLALNAADIWSEAYSARQAEEDAMKTYLKERLPKWLDTLEQFHDKTSSGGAYFFGDEPSYADFELLNSLNILVFMFGVEEFGSTLDAWKDAMESRPGVSSYLASCEPVLYPQVAKM